MNLKSEIILEVIKNERTYRLSVPVGAPFSECHEVALEMANAIIELSKDAAEQQKKEENLGAAEGV